MSETKSASGGKKILIAGEGGQGIQSVAEILARAANEQGKETTYIPNFGVEQRGGVSLAFLQIDEKPIGYPKFDQADIVVAMCNRAIDVIKKFVNDNTLFIYDSSFIDNEKIKTLHGIVKKYLSIPAKQIAQKELSIKVANILFLGAIAQELGDLTTAQINIAMNNQFKHHPEFQELNEKAFERGVQYAKERPDQEFTGSALREIQKIFEDDKKSWQRFPEYCKGCGLCLISCPQKAIAFSDDLNFLGTNLPKVDLKKCLACGTCQKICPDGAIRVSKKPNSVLKNR